MGERWVLVALIGVALFCTLATAHKSPVVEYTYVGHIWEESYNKIPLQPVVNEKIILHASVQHPNETIEGNVTSLFSIYRDDTTFDWYGGESYKNPDWLLIKEGWGNPVGYNTFEQDVVIGEPGSYHVLVDWYDNSLYMGQSMHMLDVETRTIGPLFYILGSLVILLTIVGVRFGIL